MKAEDHPCMADILENDNREAGKTVDRQSSDSIDLNGVRLVAVQRLVQPRASRP